MEHGYDAGFADDIRIYNRTFDAEQITTLDQEGGYDSAELTLTLDYQGGHEPSDSSLQKRSPTFREPTPRRRPVAEERSFPVRQS